MRWVGVAAVVCTLTGAAPAAPLTVGPARAGKALTASLPVTLDGKTPTTGSARCTLRFGKRQLRPAWAAFASGRASCRWLLPATSKGKRLAGSLRATVGSQAVTRSFSVTAR